MSNKHVRELGDANLQDRWVVSYGVTEGKIVGYEAGKRSIFVMLSERKIKKVLVSLLKK